MSGEVRPRWWPAWVIAAVAAVILVLVWSGEADGQSKVMQTMAVALLSALSLLVWALLLSRFAWRRRLRIVGGLFVLAGLIVTTVRVGGVDGDLTPILEWRWSRAAPTPDLGTVAGHSVVGSETDFPQYLGPDRDGSVAGQLDPNWDLHPPRELWREPIGPGWAGFAVVGELAVTMAQRGASEVILAYELTTGEPRWTFDYPALYETTVGGTGPRTVPTIEGGQVFAFGGTGVLTALDLASGALRWQQDVVAEHGGEVPEWGKSGAPLIVDDQVVVSAGGPDGHSLVSYAVDDGSLRWAAGSDRSGYSSPVLATLAGRRQIVIFNQSTVVGHDALNGEVLWSYPVSSGQPNVATPVILDEESLFVSAGYGIGGTRLRIAPEGDGLSVHEVWATPRLKSKFANVILYRDLLYGLDDGVLVCLDPADGERRWKQGRYGHGQLLLVGDRLLVQTEKGEVVLVDVSPDGSTERARLEVFSGKTWNPPALAGRFLALRTHEEAVVYEMTLTQ